MREQIAHLCDVVADGMPNVEVRLLPFSVGLHSLLGGAFQILSFEHGEGEVIFFEGQDSGGLQEKPEVIRAYAERLDAAWKMSLEGRELLNFLREVAASHEE
jgi:Domain of unknown function (DUF5753)